MSMAARDFIENTLLEWIKRELEDNPPVGSKQFIAGFDGAIKAVEMFINQHRHEWDVED